MLFLSFVGKRAIKTLARWQELRPQGHVVSDPNFRGPMRDLNLFCCLASDKFDAELACSASQLLKIDACMTQNIPALIVVIQIKVLLLFSIRQTWRRTGVFCVSALKSWCSYDAEYPCSDFCYSNGLVIASLQSYSKIPLS